MVCIGEDMPIGRGVGQRFAARRDRASTIAGATVAISRLGYSLRHIPFRIADLIRLCRVGAFPIVPGRRHMSKGKIVIKSALKFKSLFLGSGFLFLTTPATAQGLQYNCQNEPTSIEIPGQQLDNALAQLRLQTRCPISGTKLAKGKRSRPLVGTMTPTEALQAMLNDTGLQMRTIKGGFQIVRLPRR